MSPVDWVIAAILAVSVIGAYQEGFFVAVFSLAGLLMGLMLAGWNYQRLIPAINKVLQYVPASEVVSFLFIAFGVMILCGIVGRVLKGLFHAIGLGWADRILGAAFGLVRGAVIVTLGAMAIAAFSPHVTWLENSRLATYFLNAAHQTACV